MKPFISRNGIKKECPPLYKSAVAPLCFCERPTLVPGFANQRKSEDFLHKSCYRTNSDLTQKGGGLTGSFGKRGLPIYIQWHISHKKE